MKAQLSMSIGNTSSVPILYPYTKCGSICRSDAKKKSSFISKLCMHVCVEATRRDSDESLHSFSLRRDYRYRCTIRHRDVGCNRICEH